MPAFKDWAFYASKGAYGGADTRVPRTMPVRFSDVVNVKDWGATGVGVSHNDEPGIQAAINFAMSRGGGKVLFPPGDYQLQTTGGLVVGGSTFAPIILEGSARAAATISGFKQHMISGHLTTPGDLAYDNIQRISGLAIFNGDSSNLSSTIRITGNANGAYSPVEIFNCWLKGRCNVDASQAKGAWIHGIRADCNVGNNPANDATNPGAIYGTVGFYLGSNCVLSNTRGQSGWDIVAALSGSGAAVVGGVASEVNHTGIRVGWGRNATTGVAEEVAAYGVTVQSVQFERCGTSIDLYNCTGGFISCNKTVGNSGEYGAFDNPLLATTNTLVWSGGTVTVTCQAPHNIAANNVGDRTRRVLIEGTMPADWFSVNPVVVTGTPTSTTFTYAKASPPAVNPYNGGGDWVYAMGHFLRCRKVYETVIMNNDAGVASGWNSEIDLDYNGEADHRNNVMYAQGSKGRDWIMPSDRKNLAGWKFLRSGNNGSAAAHPFGKMMFADLPSAANIRGGLPYLPFEGMEYDIIDCAVTAAGNFGAAVTSGTGSAANHVKLRYDGTNWRISG